MYSFSNKLVRLAEITKSDRKEMAESTKEEDTIAIDERFLEKPAFAMELCRGKARDMAQITADALSKSLEVLLSSFQAQPVVYLLAQSARNASFCSNSLFSSS